MALCVAQAIMGIPSDRTFLAVAGKRLGHLFPALPRQAGYFKRRRRLADAIEWLLGIFAADCPGAADQLLLIDSAPVPRASSRETVKRSVLAEASDYGHCAAHSRHFSGFRLHLLAAPDGTPRAIELASAKVDEREVALGLLARCARGGQVLLADKGYAGAEFAAAAGDGQKWTATAAVTVAGHRQGPRLPAWGALAHPFSFPPGHSRCHSA